MDAYACIKGSLKAGYMNSGYPVAGVYQEWKSFNTQPYVSDTHGGRYVNNYVNGTGRKAYGKYENVGAMPQGSAIAKDSFAIKGNGQVVAGPLFVMEKMPPGWNPESGDWRYTLMMPNGNVVGKTHGIGAKNVGFCIDCHMPLGEDQDSLLFLPDALRK